MMMYYWVHDVKAKHVMLFEDIANWDTTVNYNNFFRVECHNWLINQQVELGGFDHNGHPKYVEINETYFFHRKYHRGRFRRGVARGLLEYLNVTAVVVGWKLFRAEKCSYTGTSYICSRSHVLPGTIIVTDGWAGYDNIDHINNGVYQHEVVVHAQNFVDPNHPEVNMQAIEGLWMQAKCKLHYQSGTSHASFPSYLDAFQSQDTPIWAVFEIAE